MQSDLYIIRQRPPALRAALRCCRARQQLGARRPAQRHGAGKGPRVAYLGCLDVDHRKLRQEIIWKCYLGKSSLLKIKLNLLFVGSRDSF